MEAERKRRRRRNGREEEAIDGDSCRKVDVWGLSCSGRVAGGATSAYCHARSLADLLAYHLLSCLSVLPPCALTVGRAVHTARGAWPSLAQIWRAIRMHARITCLCERRLRAYVNDDYH